MLLTSIIPTINASDLITSTLIYPDYDTHQLYSNIPTSPSSSSLYEAFNAARMEGLKSTKSCYLNPNNAKGLGRPGYETVHRVDPRVAKPAQLNQLFNLEIAADKSSYVQPTRLLQDFSTRGLPKLLYEQIMRGDEGTFDVIYVDGDHTEGGALFDIDISWQLLKAGGVMIIDDYFEASAGASSEKDWLAQRNGQVENVEG
ncbi:hypothetical protein TrVE_jg909 [Triparma verrucosa]|uniref:Uncharacterized protein n=1 Tax=Triparma verrucosa TaxID=1606542 RepID=A0A9W7FKY6_9STRA|nr:hypothetical protein TrVE_jg909 [Triparma verrucosa]